MTFRHSRIALALGLGGVAFAADETTFAQDIRVNVTGTNIKRVDTETAAPIETITREDIQASGLQTISEVVRQITANNSGTVSPSFTNGFSASGSAVSLRGLGSNNTLVLLNGRRLANFGLADDGRASYVDLQQIPFEAVERIEVLKDGASAIYGSDAVAGVVNVILRQQYTGFTTTATAGIGANGEGAQAKGAVTFGAGDLTRDRYNLFLTVDAQAQDAIASNTGRRYIGTNDLRFMGLPDVRSGNPGTSSTLGNVRPVAAGNPDGPFTGPFRSLPGECPPSRADGDFCRWDRLDYTDLQPRIERFNAFARGTYQVDDSTQAYAELSWFRVATDTRNQPSPTRAAWYNPATQSVRSSLNIYLPVGHPDNPFSANNQVARLYYADAANGGIDRDYRTDTQRYLAGVKGTHAQWDWDVAALCTSEATPTSRRKTRMRTIACCRDSRAQAPMATTGSGRPRFTTILRSTTRRAGPFLERAVREHDRRRQGLARPLQAGRRPTRAGGRVRVPARRNFQSRHAGHRDRQRRRQQILARRRRSQHQRRRTQSSTLRFWDN